MRCNEKRRKRPIMWGCACRYSSHTRDILSVFLRPVLWFFLLLFVEAGSSLFIGDYGSGSCGHPSLFQLFSWYRGPVVLRHIERFWEADFCFLRSETVVVCCCSLLALVHREVFLALGWFPLQLESSDITNNETFSSFLVLNCSSTSLRHKQVQKSPIHSYLAGLFESHAWLILHLNWENGTE